MKEDRNQRKAITYKPEDLLVAAGPGSGKTSVLTGRIHYLIHEKGIGEKQILVLTFTKAAAGEMKKRYLGISGKSVTAVTFGTFHSVFLSFMKDRPQFRSCRILTHEDALGLIGTILKNNGDPSENSKEFQEKLLSDISRMKNGLHPNISFTPVYYEKFVRTCKEHSFLDFDDILLEFFDLLIREPELLKELRERYRCILVDEFQDINRVQFEILKLMKEKNNCIFAVGDDDQSIYGFRGSDPVYMKLFQKTFGNCRRIILNRNYRSTGAIVSCSARLIAKNSSRIRKHSSPVRRRGHRPSILSFADISEEGRFIGKRITDIEGAYEAAGLSKPTFAVLARTNSALSEIKDFIPADISLKIDFKTFHSSKGLEYDAVFITHANESITPGKNACNVSQLEEERRTFYVAITRCRSYLHIFYTCNQYNKEDRRTRFLDEMKGLL